MAREADSNKLLVIDGQQRLKTLQFFFGGYFRPQPDEKTRRVFKLTKVQPQFEGCTYETLEAHDRIKLNDSIIHATIVKQESPSGDDTSVYHIFERLNYAGRKLTPQEIRVAIYHGELVDTIKLLNDDATWRTVFGRKSSRLKDQELILRYFALLLDFANYHRPMNEFLNKFTLKNKHAVADTLNHASGLFVSTITLLHEAVGKVLFRPERTLNAAVFDSTMVGLSRRLESGAMPSAEDVRKAYEATLVDRKASKPYLGRPRMKFVRLNQNGDQQLRSSVISNVSWFVSTRSNESFARVGPACGDIGCARIGHAISVSCRLVENGIKTILGTSASARRALQLQATLPVTSNRYRTRKLSAS